MSFFATCTVDVPESSARFNLCEELMVFSALSALEIG